MDARVKAAILAAAAAYLSGCGDPPEPEPEAVAQPSEDVGQPSVAASEQTIPELSDAPAAAIDPLDKPPEPPDDGQTLAKALKDLEDIGAPDHSRNICGATPFDRDTQPIGDIGVGKCNSKKNSCGAVDNSFLDDLGPQGRWNFSFDHSDVEFDGGDPSVFVRVLRQHSSSCRNIDGEVGQQGNVQLYMMIRDGTANSVQLASAGGSTEGHALGQCLKRRFEHAKFPAGMSVEGAVLFKAAWKPDQS